MGISSLCPAQRSFFVLRQNDPENIIPEEKYDPAKKIIIPEKNMTPGKNYDPREKNIIPEKTMTPGKNYDPREKIMIPEKNI